MRKRKKLLFKKLTFPLARKSKLMKPAPVDQDPEVLDQSRPVRPKLLEEARQVPRWIFPSFLWIMSRMIQRKKRHLRLNLLKLPAVEKLLPRKLRRKLNKFLLL